MLTNSVIHNANLPDLSNPEYWNRSISTQQKTRPLIKLSILAYAFSAALAPFAFAESPASTSAQNVIRGAEVVETVVPREFNEDLLSLPRVQPPLSEQANEINPRQQHGGPTVAPPPAFPQLDPLRQTLGRGSSRQPDLQRSRSSFDKPKLNFAGQGFSGFAPPDAIGDVGPKHYIQMINGPTGGASFVIYNKNGRVLIPQTALQNLVASGPCTTGLGDPIVLYDPLADRWLMSELASTLTDLCVYISKTNDPVRGGGGSTTLPHPISRTIRNTQCGRTPTMFPPTRAALQFTLWTGRRCWRVFPPPPCALPRPSSLPSVSRH